MSYAEKLANIFGTEQDRVNCPFYYKIGACRHGDRCSRQHNKPPLSPTLLLPNLYTNPKIVTVDGGELNMSPQELQDHFEDFFVDMFEELSKYGEIEDLLVCDNLGEHMIGNVYVKFYEEAGSQEAIRNLVGRFYAGRPIAPEFSPVTNFRESRCRQFEKGGCNRGGFCNFMHLLMPSRDLVKELYDEQSKRWKSAHRRDERDYDRRDERDYDRRDERDYDRRDRHHHRGRGGGGRGGRDDRRYDDRRDRRYDDRRDRRGDDRYERRRDDDDRRERHRSPGREGSGSKREREAGQPPMAELPPELRRRQHEHDDGAHHSGSGAEASEQQQQQQHQQQEQEPQEQQQEGQAQGQQEPQQQEPKQQEQEQQQQEQQQQEQPQEQEQQQEQDDAANPQEAAE